MRVVLVTLVVASLPFLWSEDTSCDGHAKPLVTGIEILFGKHFADPTPGLVFLGMLLGGGGLGLLVTRTQRPWRRLVGEIVAGVLGLGTTLMCVLMMTHGRPEQPLDHPAAWIGTLSALAIAFEAWWCAGEALRRGLDHRRARKASVARIVDAPPMRIGEVGALEPEPAEEDDEVLEEGRGAQRRAP